MRPSIFTPEIIQYLTDNIDTVLYEDMVKEIKLKFGRTYTQRQLSGRANNMGLKQFKPKKYDRGFFEDINTPEKAYWLGFIYADGWVCRSKTKAELGIELARRDRDHLLKFCEAIGHPEPEKAVIDFMSKETMIKKTGQIIPPKPSTKVRLYSMQIVDNLISHGVELRKTYSTTTPEFKYGENLNIALLRGYFDGDGCLDRNGFIHFTAFGDAFLIKVKTLLSALGIETYKIYYENEFKSRLMIKEKDHKRFLDIVYQDQRYSYLNRKFELYNSIHK